MLIKTDGLVIGERNMGESDRLVTVLTREEGIVRGFARQASRYKSRRFAGTQLLCYSRFQIFKGRDTYIIDEAQPVELFFDLRLDILRLSLAQYFCQLAASVAPQQAPAGDFLRLFLNALHYLSKGTRPLPLLKAAVEMRALSLAGYMPDLVGCRQCGCYEAPGMRFYPVRGELYCQECCQGKEAGSFLLSPGVLMALRHTVYADFEKLFQFTLSAPGQQTLQKITEAYVLATLDRGFRTLDFYHQLQMQEGNTGETGPKPLGREKNREEAEIAETAENQNQK